jgi:CRISPR-associated protein Cas1
VLYLVDEKEHYQYRNIPIANTIGVFFGTGISITKAALRMLVLASVLLGVCRIESPPLGMASKIGWLPPQNEHRQAEYMQGWPA